MPSRLSAIAVALLMVAPLVAVAAEPAAEAPAAADAAKPAPGSEPEIAEIRVQGNRRVEADAVRTAMKSKVGKPFDADELAEDLRRIWRLGFFSDVQLLVDDSKPDKPVVIVQVEEKPAVRQVAIRGNKELSDEDLKDIVDIKPFSILDMAAVRRNAKRLQEKYVEKGFYLAEVSPRVDPVDNNEVLVFLDVNEHAKVQVKRVTFVGNEKIPAKDLQEVMQTEPGSLLSFLTGAGTFREDVFQRDVAMIQGVYYDRGFIHVRVSQPQVALSADKRLIYITIPISEGEQYNVGKIDFAGDILGTKEELGSKMTVKSGELFNRSKLQRDIAALTDIYYDAGYAYANIAPQTTVEGDKKIVDLTYEIDKGEKVFIERIEVVGNSKTRDKVIRREMRVYEGELFSGTGLRQSRQRVTALGFFETVDVTQRAGSKPNQVVVTVTVKEKPTGTFQVGLGISSVENLLLTAQVSQNNLFGWGQTGSLQAQISSLRSLIQVSFLDPYFLDSPWIFSFNFFRQELDYFGFLRKSTGGDVTWGYHLTEDLMLHLGYAIEDIAVAPGGIGGSSEILLANRFRNGLTSSLRLTVNYDKRDNRLFPTSGNYQSVSVEHSPEWLGASFLFTRYIGNSRWYFPLPAGLVFKSQGTVGYIAGNNLPISELFFAGGINTLRGYNLRSVAPTVRVGSGRSPDAALLNPAFGVGGNKELIFNFELEFPIFEKVGIRGVAFYDAGNVFAENEDFFQYRAQDLPLGLLHSVGIGFRWFSPIGPLRFEWGFPLVKRPIDTEPFVFEFTIGNSF